MNQPVDPMPDPTASTPSKPVRPSRRPRRRWMQPSLAGAMLLIAIVAVGLAALKRQHQLQVIVLNRGADTIRSLTIWHAEHQARIGPIEPHSTQVVWIPTDQLSRQIEAAANVHPSSSGGSREVSGSTSTDWHFDRPVLIEYDDGVLGVDQ